MNRITCVLCAFSLALIASQVLADDRSLERGREMFGLTCGGSCHAIGCNKKRYGTWFAPKLGGVVGRKAGSLQDFSAYSDDLRQSGTVWTVELLDKLLSNPADTVHGSRGVNAVESRTGMSSASAIDDVEVRKDVIAFIQSGDTSFDLCPR